MKKALLTIFLIVFIDLMGFGIMMPNLQLYGQRFGINSYFTLTLVGASYSIFQFIFAPILGRWSDRIGRRPVMLISQAGTLVGFMILFAAHWFEKGNGQAEVWGIVLIFASRIIDGISGGNISTAMAYVADISSPENRAKYMGMVMAAFGLGFMFGPMIGGVVAYYIGLQWVPIAASIFSFAALSMTFMFLHESLPPEKRSVGAKASTSIFHALLDRVFGMRHAVARPVIGPMILMSFVNGFAFAGMEQTFSLLIRLRVYGSRPDILNPQVMDEVARRSSRGSSFLFFMIGSIIVVIQGGMIHRLTKKFGEARLVIAGPLFIAAGMFIVSSDLSRLFPGLWPWTGFVLGSACFALGSSIFNPSVQALISRHAGEREQGEVLGANQGMSSLARALGPVVAGLLFQYVLAGTRFEGAAPYWFSGFVCVAVSIWAMGMKQRLKPPAVKVSNTMEPQTIAE